MVRCQKNTSDRHWPLSSENSISQLLLLHLRGFFTNRAVRFFSMKNKKTGCNPCPVSTYFFVRYFSKILFCGPRVLSRKYSEIHELVTPPLCAQTLRRNFILLILYNIVEGAGLYLLPLFFFYFFTVSHLHTLNNTLSSIEQNTKFPQTHQNDFFQVFNNNIKTTTSCTVIIFIFELLPTILPVFNVEPIFYELQSFYVGKRRKTLLLSFFFSFYLNSKFLTFLNYLYHIRYLMKHILH